MSYGSLTLSTLVLALSPFVAAQTASFSGQLKDPQQIAVAGVQVNLRNPVTGWERSSVTSLAGRFQFTNIPLETYTVSIVERGFLAVERQIALRSTVPVEMQLVLQLAGQTIQVDVAEGAQVLVDAQSSSTRHSLSAENFEHLPSQAGTRGLESVLLSFPGFEIGRAHV